MCLVFLILAPKLKRNRYLKILSSFAKLLKHRRVIDRLLAAGSSVEAISVLKKHEALIRLHSDLGV